MSTVAQINANRANAQLSTGPVTIAGLARSSQNARTHGITMNIANLQGEQLAAYNELLNALIAEFKPKCALEYHCVRDMAAAEWRLETINAHQQELLAQPGLEQNARTLSLLLRYEAAARRAFEHAVAELRRNRKNPLATAPRMSYEERHANLERIFGKEELLRIRSEAEADLGFLPNEPKASPSLR